MVKRCTTCNEEKLLLKFYKEKFGKYGVAARCKKCSNIANGQWAKDNHDKRREHVNKWRKANLSKANKYAAKWRKANPEKTRAHGAVARAIKSNKIPAASLLLCNGCGNQAQEYHHWSYLEEHLLDVKPICKKCHGGIRN